MNPAKPTPFSFGNLKGTIYDFTSIGDVLAKHSHTPETAHITIVAKGKIKITAGDWTYDAEAGKSYVAMAKMLENPLTSIADLSKIDLSTAVQPKNMKSPEFDTSKTEIVAQKEKEAQDKAALEKQQAEYREKLKQEETMAMTGPQSQNSGAEGPIDLNTALAELIAISKRTADLNEKQLSVQSSLSGDLFA